MEYFGAADYYFWQGIEMALVSDINDVDAYTETMFTMDNETTRSCQEAFKWGFALGLTLTQEEYTELTNPPVVVNVKKKEKTVNTPLSGNC